jgi:electron transport complex protein RnfC
MRQASTFARGGIAPPDRTALTAGIPIRNACIPSEAVIPLRQQPGEPAQCLVRAGDAVTEGMLIGRARSPGYGNVHASIPGTVREIAEWALPDGSSSPAVVIELGGEFPISGRASAPVAWPDLPDSELLERIRERGVTDWGPTHPGVDFLVVNGVEREPYLTADLRLMIEHAPQIITGLQILGRILQPTAVVIGVEEPRIEALESLRRASASASLQCRIEPLQARYPQWAERQLLEALLGRSAAMGSEGGVAVIGVAALYSVYEAVVLSKPLLERVVTVTGLAVRAPANLKARLGTRIGELIEECGGFAEPPARLLAGGPMMGWTQCDLDAPVTRELAGLIAMSRAEIRPAAETPCIGCGRCLKACPWGLVPVEIYKAVEHRRLAEAAASGLAECTECGCCAYVCPARIPLVAGMRRGKALAEKA